ncbi:MAG: hypothetical protein WDW38_003326 [Sanguina aurantia]
MEHTVLQKKAARLAAKAPPKSAPYTPPAPAPVAAAPAPAAAVSDSAPAAAASKPLTAAEMAASVHSSQAPGMSTGENDKTTGKMGASGIGSGIRLEGISMTFKNQSVLKNCCWEVKKGERVGLVGVNGAGKTTQLQIIMGKLQQDSGEIIKAKKNMRIAYLAQEFDVQSGRTVREEFYSVYQQQMQVMRRQSEISLELESVGEDMEKMQGSRMIIVLNRV